ncbi:MAG: efflux RND transporter permease subunit [Myxococcota bacterium]
MDVFARFTINNARAAILVVVSILGAGAAVFMTQPRQEDPEIAIRKAQIVTRLPGLTPKRMEQQVTIPIEETAKQVPEIDEITSVSYDGLSIVSVEVDGRYRELLPIWTKLRNKMRDLAPRLPEGTVGPIINDDYGRVAVVTLALTGPDFSMAELEGVAEDLRDDLATLPLVATVDLYGVQSERIWLEFDMRFLAQLEIDPSQVFGALRSRNLVLPSGTVEADGVRVHFNASGDFRSVEEIRNLPVPTDDGLVYLRDIAKVTRGYANPPDAPAFFNGQAAVVLGLSMVEASNVVELGRQVSKRLTELRRTLPVGMKLDVAIFQPDLVQAAVTDSVINLLQTMVVVLIVVMAFLGFRTGLIVGAMVPLTVMVTLIGMAIGGIALHRISIAAIIVALGLLVDNGVVIAEDIRRRMDDGASRLEAAFATPRQLSIPLLTSSLTTILAFMPLILVNDETGEFLRSLGQVLTIALLASWALAISVTPALCYWFLQDRPPGAATSQPTSTQGPAYAAYARLLHWLLRHRGAFAAAMVLMLVAATQVFAYVKQRSLGPSARNQFTAYVELPAEAGIEKTIEATQGLSAFLLDERKNPEVDGVLSYVGTGGPRFFLALNPPESRPNKGFLIVNTKTAEDVETVIHRVERYIVRELPEASGRAEILFLGPAALGTVELQVRGPDIDKLRRIGSSLINAFHSVPGTVAIRQDWENAVLQFAVDVDQERAQRVGVSSQQVGRGLAAVFDGLPVTNYREDDKSIPVVLRANPEDRATLSQVRTVEMRSETDGEPVPLMQIADFNGQLAPSKIRRVDQKRALTVAGKNPSLTSKELYAAMQDELDALDLPPGYEIILEGELKGSKESNQKLFAFVPHALFGILVLLVLQFNSFRRPAIILLTIPLVLIGANFGLALFGAYFDFTAMLGVFSLAGIIINNGIVLIDRVDEARHAGATVNEAVVDAGLARARPIIMTTITTVVGLIPLALSGGEFWFGMSIVIMCGLAVGTILTLGFVPVLYSLLFRGRPAESIGATT